MTRQRQSRRTRPSSPHHKTTSRPLFKRFGRLTPAPATVFIALLVISLGLSAGWWLGKPSTASEYTPKSKARVLSEPKSLSAFELTTHTGGKLNVDSLKGKWTWMFFGYTHCPDVCPVTLAEVSRLFKHLRTQPELADTQAVFVSVDPERDTPEILASYVSYFDPAIIGATDDRVALETLTGQLSIKHSRGSETTSGYTVNHTSALLLIDPEARYYAYVLPPHYAEDLYYHYTSIRDYYDESNEAK